MIFFDYELHDKNSILKNIELLYNDIENKSFYDSIDYKLKNISKKNFNFLKNTYKINEEFENGEYFQLKKFFDYSKKNINIINDNSHDFFNKRINEDKNFYHNYLNDHCLLTKKEVGQYNFLINSLYNLKEENLDEIFGIRKTRRTTKNSNKKENIKQKENEKLNLINKLFSKAPSEQIERFINSHKEHYIYSDFKNKEDEKDERYKIMNTEYSLGYYNNFKVFDQIKNEQTKLIENTFETSEDDIDLEEEDEILIDSEM